MSKRKRRDLSGTAYCAECKETAQYERGIGSPLSIKHRPECSESSRKGRRGR